MSPPGLLLTSTEARCGALGQVGPIISAVYSRRAPNQMPAFLGVEAMRASKPKVRNYPGD
jgi:hypothetical protein